MVDYGRGFFEGAEEIVDAVMERNGIVDILVYPICFSFRHGIELYLKAIVNILPKISNKPHIYNKHHRIDQYWKFISAEVNALDDKIIDKAEIGIVADIISDFIEIDPTGQVFKYPEDIKGNAHLTGLKLINVEVLKEGMAILRERLDSWYFRFEHILELRREGY